MRTSALLFPLLAYSVLLLVSCKKDDPQPAFATFTFYPTSTEAEVQGALIDMKDGDTIYFTQGNYQFSSMLSIDGKSNIVVMGDGRNNTELSFENQTTGAQSLYGTSLTWVLFKDFTITEPDGDGIKVKDSDGITFLRVGVTHSNPVDSTNGAYGLYPVASKNILIDDCYVLGTSDAGIYVGQSEQVIVRNSEVEGNVAGIEIENCINADVYDNHSHDNAAGIIVLDLPDLPVIKNGHTSRVFNNNIVSNDLRNFAPGGNIVASIPTGTGIMLNSAKTAEIFGNTLTENNVMTIGIISYNTLVTLNGLVLTDTLYVPFSTEVNIHSNVISSSTNYPPHLNTIADLIVNSIFGGGDVPDILIDGYVHPDYSTDPSKSFCIRDNGSASFVNLDIPGFFTGLSLDPSPHDCIKSALPVVVVNAPTN